MWAQWVGEEEARPPTRCRRAFAPTKAAGGLEPLKERLKGLNRALKGFNSGLEPFKKRLNRNRALIAKERLRRALMVPESQGSIKRLKEP